MAVACTKMEDAKIKKLWIDTLFGGTKVVKLMSYVRLEFSIDCIHQGVSCCILNDTFWMWNHSNYSGRFSDNSKCKCDQGDAILDGIEFQVSKTISKDICITWTLRSGLRMSVSFAHHVKVVNCCKCIF